MPPGPFTNQTDANCTAPFLEESFFSTIGGYQHGRYCDSESFGNGTTCCFPCPIQDWLYPPEWRQQLRIPNYLAVLSVVLCFFLLLSFAVLPAEQTHRHYLSVGLLFPVLLISLSFAIPATTIPSLCYDGITPNNMHSSMSCAWTGSFVTVGGLGCVIWVFLRSLWLHVRIFWDRDLGRKFKWGSIMFGTLLPLIFLTAVLVATGFSYRMGNTCLPNHEHAVITFWVWLVGFAILAFLLQSVTTGYCFYVYIRTLRRDRRSTADDPLQSGQAQRRMSTWSNVQHLFLLQWRNVLVSVFVIIGSISFFVVFWRQDHKLESFHDPENIKLVKMWTLCQTLSTAEKNECLKYVKDFTINQSAILTSLILASLVGIEIFILLFRISLVTAWASFFRRNLHRVQKGRPPTPELTSLENPDMYLPPSSRERKAISSAFSADTPSTVAGSANVLTPNDRGSSEMDSLEQRPTYKRLTSEPEISQLPGLQMLQSSVENRSSTPASSARSMTPIIPIDPPSPPAPPAPTHRPLSQIQPSLLTISIPGSSIPMRNAPSPPLRNLSSASNRYRSRMSIASTIAEKEEPGAGSSIQKSNSGKLKARISAPIVGSFVHVDGAFLERSGGFGMGHITGEEGERWDDEETRGRRLQRG